VGQGKDLRVRSQQITTHYRLINHEEIGGYFGTKGSAISQLSRRFKETIKGDKELGGILGKIKDRAA